MSRYLVTGGAGFIGGALAQALVGDGHDVTVVDNLSTGRRDRVPADAVFVEADLADPKSVDRIPDGHYEAVLHLAAQSSGARAENARYHDLLVNVGATLSLTEWCLSRGVTRFIYASSMTVYGSDTAEGRDEQTGGLQPISTYGVSKLSSEGYLDVARYRGLKPTALRLFNVYGPGQNLADRQQGMASIYLAYLLDGNAVPVTGSLSRYRDFVHVDDVVAAFRAALARPETPSGAYNIGTGIPTTVARVLALLKEGCGLPDTHPVEELEGQPTDIFGSVATIDRAAHELGWTPRIKPDDGLRAFAAWARARVVADVTAAASAR